MDKFDNTPRKLGGSMLSALSGIVIAASVADAYVDTTKTRGGLA